MSELRIPEGRYEAGRALHRGRVRRLKRAQSFHPDEQPYMKGPDFKYGPIWLNSDSRSHRTISAFKALEEALLSRLAPTVSRTVSRTMSSDHIPKIDIDKPSSEYDPYYIPPDEPEFKVDDIAARYRSHEQHGTNVSELVFDSATLCKRCSGVNINSISAEDGYVHLTLDVIKAQASTCRLCKVLFDTQSYHFRRRTDLDRFRLVLSLTSETMSETMKSSKSGHFIENNSWKHLAKVVSNRIVDTRPHEFLEAPGWMPHTEDYLVKILCYTDEDDPAREEGVPWLRSIGHNTASVKSLNIAKGWFEECLKTESPTGTKSEYSKKRRSRRTRIDVPPVEVDHAWGMPECTQASRPEKFAAEGPTRLLFIVDPADMENSRIRLIETHGISYSYATLSYCWGRAEDEWLCTKHKLDQYLDDIDRKTLPATIRDCLVIAATLSMQYIWIDALCIIQDSASDWTTESTKMGGIYYGSLLTIAATTSSQSDGGCFNETSRPRFSDDIHEVTSWRTQYPRSDLVGLESILEDGSKSRLYIVTGNSTAGYFAYDTRYEDEVENGPLSKRAWVFQEQMLSHRIIYYAQSQLFWECEHCRLSEDNWLQIQASQIYPITTYEEPMSTLEVIEKWYLGAVQTYSARSLSHFTDKLVAISAAAKATYLNRHVEYCAGLWKDCIMTGLLWTRQGSGRKSRRYACPSWSWASQESGVSYGIIWEYRQISRTSPLYQPRIIDVNVETDPLSPFGDVKSGYIKLDTLVTSGWVMRHVRLYPGNTLEKQFIFSNPGRTDVWSALAVMDDDDHQGSKLTVAFLGLFSHGWVALLLETVRGETQTYRRVGILASRIHDCSGSVETAPLWMNSGIKPQCITIV
jgi:hypothetical protein